MPVILQISAGLGPAECRKFVPLLAEIICREAAQNGLRCNNLTEPPAKNKEIASMRFAIEGANIDAFRKSWEGTIKWIWQSTIRPNWPRKNWFVKVSFFEFEAKNCGSFKSSDLKIETCRASGNGGQHVNTTDSAAWRCSVIRCSFSCKRSIANALLRVWERSSLADASVPLGK